MTKKKRRFPVRPASTFEEFSKKLESYKENLHSSAFYSKLCEDIQKCCVNSKADKIEQILCYGLGNFATCLTARYQLALLMLFKARFEVVVNIYDPVFSPVELDFLKDLQLSIIDRNEEGARDVNCTSLIYMPHCPTALMNNLLWHNWSPRISNCIILGNSFHSISFSHTESKFKAQFSYIHSILPYAVELEVANIFTHTDIFNDLSLHYFPPSLQNVPETFWMDKMKPEYDNTDVECISSKLKSSKIDEKFESDAR